jgi:excisionase family DNA binding protein
MSPLSDPLLTQEEAAELLGVKERFIRRLVQERRISHIKIGRHIRIRQSQLEAFVQTNSRPATDGFAPPQLLATMRGRSRSERHDDRHEVRLQDGKAATS